jgi:hypothetical protein
MKSLKPHPLPTPRPHPVCAGWAVNKISVSLEGVKACHGGDVLVVVVVVFFIIFVLIPMSKG